MHSRNSLDKNARKTLATLAVLLGLSLSCDSSTGPGDESPGASLQLSTVIASQATIVANGTSTAQITVALKDETGASLGKSAGALALSTTRGTIAAPADKGDGSYTATLTSSTTAGPAVISASLAGSALSNTATVTFVPGPVSAVTIANASSNGQSATVGELVASPPSVKVADANGNGVQNVTVVFAVTGGGGSITGATQITSEAGVATVGSWRLGTAAGANTLTASVTVPSASATAGSSAVAEMTVTFTANAIASAPGSISANGGDGQTAVAGTVVPIAPSVKVVDGSGNPVSGATVNFAVVGGGGSITGASTSTSFTGIATVGSWTLGSAAGPNSVTASAPGVSGSVTFNATGTPGSMGTLIIVVGNAQTAVAGSNVATAPSVKISDANGNAISGATVTFAVATGGGSVTGGTATSNASGIATVGSWKLGPAAGPNSLTASSGSLSPVTFTATGTTGPAALITISAGNNQTASRSTAVATPPSVKVTDANSNVVSGASVTFAVTAGGGNVTGPNATTNESGIATVGSWTLGSGSSTNTLTATLNGVSGASVVFNAIPSALPPLVIAVTGRLERSETVSVSVSQDGTTLAPAGVTVTVTPADAAQVNADGTIVLKKTGALTINAVAADRSGSRGITVAQPPVIVFDLLQNFTRQIWEVALDGGDLRQLTTVGSDNQHGSRVGNKLVYASARNGRTFDLFSMNILDASETQITNTSFAERDPNLSPNGARIVYLSNEVGLDRAVYSNLDGSAKGFVDDIANNTGAIEISPAWSPTSDKIVLSSTATGAGATDIYIQNSLGGFATLLPAPANTSAAEVNPVWNAAGQIAFHTTRSGPDEIWITNTSGSSASLVTAGTSPTWTSDGRLVFVRFTGGNGALYWVDPANSSVVHPITVGGGDARRPSVAIP